MKLFKLQTLISFQSRISSTQSWHGCLCKYRHSKADLSEEGVTFAFILVHRLTITAVCFSVKFWSSRFRFSSWTYVLKHPLIIRGAAPSQNLFARSTAYKNDSSLAYSHTQLCLTTQRIRWVYLETKWT